MPTKEAAAPTADTSTDLATLVRGWQDVVHHVRPIVDRLRSMADELETKFAALGPAKPRPPRSTSPESHRWEAYRDDQNRRVKLVKNYEQQAVLSLFAATCHGAVREFRETLRGSLDAIAAAQPPGHYIPRLPKLVLALCGDRPYGLAKTLRVTLSMSTPDTIGRAVAESMRYFAGLANSEVVELADSLRDVQFLQQQAAQPTETAPHANDVKPRLRFIKSTGQLTINDDVVLWVPVGKQLALVLEWFDEKGWPDIVDDPLPKPRRKRCSQIAARLNSRQKTLAVRFTSERDGKAFGRTFVVSN